MKNMKEKKTVVLQHFMKSLGQMHDCWFARLKRNFGLSFTTKEKKSYLYVDYNNKSLSACLDILDCSKVLKIV
jgi:hypothetical protein